MAGPYPRITTCAIALALAACGGGKDEAAPTQEPPQVVRVADTQPDLPRGSRYDGAALLLQISFTRGQYGSQTSAVQTHVSVVDDKLFFTRTPHGAEGERVNRALRLSRREQDRVAQLIRDTRLGTLETIRLARQPDAPHEYASASIKVRVDGVEHTFAIAGVTRLEGAPTAFSDTSSLAAVVKVVDELEALVNAR